MIDFLIAFVLTGFGGVIGLFWGYRIGRMARDGVGDADEYKVGGSD